MKVNNISVKADILKTLMSEDRQEVRGIRSSIYNILTLLTGYSFVLSSFLFNKETSPRLANICLLTDVTIIAFIWIIYLSLKKDLYHCRQCLVARQNLIKKLDDNDTNDMDPFPDAREIAPDINDTDLWWIPTLATVAILLKMLVICAMTWTIVIYPNT